MFYKEMSEEDFRLFRDFIYDKSGINYTINKKIILQNRIRRRLRDLNLDSYKDYYNIIKNKNMNHEEIVKFFNEVTTNETSFFRHEKQFLALRDMIVPELVEMKKHSSRPNLNVWSAAASMGKEAYTIAMVLSTIKELKNYKTKILATDLNSKVLEMAKRGEYDLKDFRYVPKEYEKFYKINEEKGIVEISDILKQNIKFTRFNLMDKFIGIEKMDIIFCRNVFIYFNKSTQREIVDKFYDILNPGGFFILGHSETLNGVNENFHSRKMNNENLMIYQK